MFCFGSRSKGTLFTSTNPQAVYILCAGTKNGSSFVDTLACRIPICSNCRRISATCRFSKLQLLDSVRIGIRIKGYSIRTEKSYVSWIKRFILFHDKRHPNEVGKVEIEAFLSYIVSFAPALTSRTTGYVTRSSGGVGRG